MQMSALLALKLRVRMRPLERAAYERLTWGFSTKNLAGPLRRQIIPDPNKVYPTGLTLAEAEELHGHVIYGTRVFGAIAVVAHILAYLYSPWLH